MIKITSFNKKINSFESKLIFDRKVIRLTKLLSINFYHAYFDCMEQRLESEININCIYFTSIKFIKIRNQQDLANLEIEIDKNTEKQKLSII